MFVENVSIDELVESGADLLISACGFELRATAVAKKLEHARIPRRMAAAFTKRRVMNFDDNRKRFVELGFDVKDIDEDSVESLEAVVVQAIDNCLVDSHRENARVIVDYSSVTRSWLAALVDVTLRYSGRVEVIFVYCAATFSEPGKSGEFNESVEPVKGFWSLSEPGMSVCLVLGLGYEELRALGAREMIDPAKTCLFLADPPLDSRYLDRVKTANELLLEQTPNDEHFGYDPLNPEYTFRLLADVCEGSLKSGAVIIVPLGPKPFALVSLVVARSLEGVEVWRVSGGSYEDAVDRAPSDVFIGCRIPAHLQA